MDIFTINENGEDGVDEDEVRDEMDEVEWEIDDDDDVNCLINGGDESVN